MTRSRAQRNASRRLGNLDWQLIRPATIAATSQQRLQGNSRHDRRPTARPTVKVPAETVPAACVRLAFGMIYQASKQPGHMRGLVKRGNGNE